MRRCHRLLAGLLLLGTAACAARAPAPPQPAPREERFEPRIGLGPRTSPPSILLRPAHSARTANQPPLYVVNGVVQEQVPQDLVDEPHRIESIEVFRGQAAVDRYGSRAGHGVIVITTKRGGGG